MTRLVSGLSMVFVKVLCMLNLLKTGRDWRLFMKTAHVILACFWFSLKLIDLSVLNIWWG